MIDGIGIAQACNNVEFNTSQPEKPNFNICNCDGALPKKAWGRTIQYTDPCGLEKEAKKDWIAAPVVGGVALVVSILLLAFLWRRRRSKQSRLVLEGEEMELSSTNYNRSPQSNYGLGVDHPVIAIPPPAATQASVSTPSDASIQSGDSGVALIDSHAGPSNVKR
jgi:hypothetical protein